jgi:hypothetical protein
MKLSLGLNDKPRGCEVMLHASAVLTSGSKPYIQWTEAFWLADSLLDIDPAV